MLTVVVLLSGPHRLNMLSTALMSIPMESPWVSAVHIMHQGGPWDWGGELRQRVEANPKVKVYEFPERVDFAQSFNRTLDTVETTWALMLPDDDHLIESSARAAFDAVAVNPAARDCGFVAFGWYYLRDGRYLASYVKRGDLASMIYYAPKMCATLLNVNHVRTLGGFDGKVGGFCDSALFTKLAYEYDALLSQDAIGVYRLHSGQESAKRVATYGPYVAELRELIGRYARSPHERAVFERKLADVVRTRPKLMAEIRDELHFRLCSRATPATPRSEFVMRKWSSR
jgi:hypothetical protein